MTVLVRVTPRARLPLAVGFRFERDPRARSRQLPDPSRQDIDRVAIGVEHDDNDGQVTPDEGQAESARDGAAKTGNLGIDGRGMALRVADDN